MPFGLLVVIHLVVFGFAKHFRLKIASGGGSLVLIRNPDCGTHISPKITRIGWTESSAS
jgi:hypothetical protein